MFALLKGTLGVVADSFGPSLYNWVCRLAPACSFRSEDPENLSASPQGLGWPLRSFAFGNPWLMFVLT